MSGRYRDWNLDCKVYVGNLQEYTTKSDVENTFCRYGPLRKVWMARNPPGFAFVEFESARDAEDAVRGLDGTQIGGTPIRVEMSHGRTRTESEFKKTISICFLVLIIAIICFIYSIKTTKI